MTDTLNNKRMSRIKSTEINKAYIQRLKEKFGFKYDYTPAQIGINLSIQKGKNFEVSEFELSDNRGKEYDEDTLFGSINGKSNRAIYKAILDNHYNKNLEDEDFYKLVKLHLDHGIETLTKEVLNVDRGKNAHVDYLMSVVKNGLGNVSDTYINSNTVKKDHKAFDGLIEIELGILSADGSPVNVRFNDRNALDPQHIAIAGMAGSGKTELMKDILYQINQKGEGDLKFIFFDYKGEGQSGQLKTFLKATNCEFVDIKEKAFQFNPLAYVNIANERARDGHIKMFRDAVLAIDRRMGAKQRNYLETVLQNCFNNSKRTGKHPNINDIHAELHQYYEDNRIALDTLTSVMDELAGSNMTVFEDGGDGIKLSDKNVYLSLPSTLGKMARQAIVFMVLNYIYAEFIDTNDVQIQENGIKPMRYVVVIDEAHNFLGSVNMREILEKMLREIRSKGVSVMMISQGMEDYKQQGFDFASQVKLAILLNVQNKHINTAKYFLGTPTSEATLSRALQSLEPQKAIINLKEPQLFEISQFWKRKL